MPTHYKGTDREVQTLNTFIKLMRASDSITNRLSQHLSANNLTISQFGVMEILLHMGPQNQKTLGKKLLKTGGNITMVIENLIKQGWVSKTKDPDDGRAVLIALTKKGKTFIEDFFPLHLNKIMDEFADLSPEEMERLGSLCKKVGQAPK